jgi:hypothetical protein
MESICIIVLTLLTASIAVAENDCVFPAGYVSESAKPLSPAAFAAISKEMITSEIIKRLGPAVRDAGSGLFVLEWKSTDGRVFHVSTTSLCSKPMMVGFNNPRASNSSLKSDAAKPRTLG